MCFRVSFSLFLASLCAFCLASEYRKRFPLPASGIPDGLGVNIHFTDPKPGEMELLTRAGYKWVRMDFLWQNIERKKGIYDFSAYDRLTATLKKHGLRAIFILDYGNKIYQKPSGSFEHDAPSTPAAVKAFCRFVEKGVNRYKGQGIVWEMYNEPNGWFWFPASNVRDYSRLGVEVGKTIRKTAPEEWYVGPALYRFDYAFLEGCASAGLLKYWDAVTIHPYEIGLPEAAVPNWTRLRQYLKEKQPKKMIPIICGEFGLCDIDAGVGIERQGDYAVRTYLANVASGVGLTIWYDWNDDGPSPTEREHHFGTMTQDLRPKPAYSRVKTMVEALNGSRFVMRLSHGSPDDWILVFKSRAGKGIAVGWNAAFTPSSDLGLISTPRILDSTELDPALVDRAANYVQLPSTVDAVGAEAIAKVLWPLASNLQQGEVLRLSDEKTSSFVEVVKGQASSLSFLIRDLPFVADRTRAISRIRATLVLSNGKQFSQACYLRNPSPINVGISIQNEDLVVGFETTGQHEEFTCTAHAGITQLKGANRRLSLRKSQSATQTFEIGRDQINEPIKIQLWDKEGKLAGETDPLTIVPVNLKDLAWSYVPDGDASVAASVAGRVLDGSTMSIDYRFSKGWRFLRIVPNTQIASDPNRILTGISIWINGDASGNLARMRFIDATNQTHQVDGPVINWKGPRLVTFLFNAPSGAWGGASDYIVHNPIRIDSILLIDGLGKETQGTLSISNLSLIYTSKR